MRIPWQDVDLSVFDQGTNRLERCGVIIEDGRKYRMIELPNRAKYPSEDFVLRAEDVHLHLRGDDVIVGVVHTHPAGSSPDPSAADILAIPHGVVGMVYHPSTTSRTLYSRKGIIKPRRKWRKR